MQTGVDNMTVVKDILDRMLPSGDLRPLLDGLADDAVFAVAAPGGGPVMPESTGKAAARDYFATLGDLVTFWRVKVSGNDARVMVQVEESFTVQPGGLPAHSEYALLFDLRDGLITRLLVVEGSPALGVPLSPSVYAASRPGWTARPRRSGSAQR
jgi:ketosteroid isomerase-like protein